VFVLCLCVMCITCLLYCCNTATGLKPNCSLTNTYIYINELKIEEFNGIIGNGTRYLAARNTVPHPTTKPRAPNVNCKSPFTAREILENKCKHGRGTEISVTGTSLKRRQQLDVRPEDC
jgi:hypothetical protein